MSGVTTQRRVRQLQYQPSTASAEGYTFLTSVSATEITALTGAGPGRTYPLETQRWLDYACHVAGRNLTKDEWASYLGERSHSRTCDGLG